MGRTKLALRAGNTYELRLRDRMTTVIAIDDRIATPRDLFDGVKVDPMAARRLSSYVRNAAGSVALHPVRFDAKLFSLEDQLGNNYHLTDEEMAAYVGEVFEEYRAFCDVSLTEAYPESQGACRVPDDCPERFRGYFPRQESSEASL